MSLVHGNTGRSVALDDFDLRDCKLTVSIHKWCVNTNFEMVLTPSVAARISASLFPVRPLRRPHSLRQCHNSFADRLSTAHPRPAHFPITPSPIPRPLKLTSGARWLVVAWPTWGLFFPDFSAKLVNMCALLRYCRSQCVQSVVPDTCDSIVQFAERFQQVLVCLFDALSWNIQSSLAASPHHRILIIDGNGNPSVSFFNSASQTSCVTAAASSFSVLLHFWRYLQLSFILVFPCIVSGLCSLCFMHMI